MNPRRQKQNFNRNALVVEQTLTSLANTTDMARTLNELGVLQYLQHDTQYVVIPVFCNPSISYSYRVRVNMYYLDSFYLLLHNYILAYIESLT